MIAIAFPVGSSHGWGVCGKYVTRELASLLPNQIRLITQSFSQEALGDELEFHDLARLTLQPQDGITPRLLNGVNHLPMPLLAAVVDKTMTSWAPAVRGSRTVGYTFFEENAFEPAWIENARRNYDLVATGSTWCTDILKAHGLQNVHTVIQGIDPRLFFPWPSTPSTTDPREFLKDRFVIFSGGKFELRKGQDIVIRAVKVMQDRHPDVFLINSWFNPWPQSVASMRNSPYLRWPAVNGNYTDTMNALLAENGLDLSRVLTLGPRANALTPRIYRNTDVGLFPNRCEGGTNLVLMEYMACGKPVVAAASTGHSDIVRPENALVIRINGTRTYHGPTGPAAHWPEPDLDDTLDKLEYAYQHRSALSALGTQAGADLASRTWTHTARAFQQLLT